MVVNGFEADRLIIVSVSRAAPCAPAGRSRGLGCYIMHVPCAPKARLEKIGTSHEHSIELDAVVLDSYIHVGHLAVSRERRRATSEP